MPNTRSVNLEYKNINELPRRHYPIKILQFGHGNFIRGFADWMIQEANNKINFNAGVTVVQSISSDTTLENQNGIYTVILKGMKGGEFKNETFQIDSIQRVIFPTRDYEAFLKEALNPDLQFIISNTTEVGIEFNESDRDIMSPASSFPGKLTQLLFHRFKHNIKGNLIILPTELIDKNGTILKSIAIQYASLWGLPVEFTQWLNLNVTFCNTLVDRIVSGFPKKPKDEVFKKLGVKDELVVEAEWFHLWAIEGPRWISEVLPFKKAGFNVEITNDLTIYRTRKVRILNGAHTCMAVMGSMLGLQTVRSALDHPNLGRLIRRMIYEEIVPHIPGDILELEKYADEVVMRFRNLAIEHKLEHIAQNSLSKFKVRVLPSIIDNIERNGQLPERLALALASLLYFFSPGKNKNITTSPDSTDFKSVIENKWHSYLNGKLKLEELSETLLTHPYWGYPLEKNPNLIKIVNNHLKNIISKGMLESLKLI